MGSSRALHDQARLQSRSQSLVLLLVLLSPETLPDEWNCFCTVHSLDALRHPSDRGRGNIQKIEYYQCMATKLMRLESGLQSGRPADLKVFPSKYKKWSMAVDRRCLLLRLKRTPVTVGKRTALAVVVPVMNATREA